MQATWERAEKDIRFGSGALLVVIILLAILINAVPLIERTVMSGKASVCLMKNFTGVPCMGCRGTRAAFAFAHGRPDQALGWNPLLASIAIGLTIWAFTTSILGWQLRIRKSREENRLFIILIIFLLIGNWIYVIAAGG